MSAILASVDVNHHSVTPVGHQLILVLIQSTHHITDTHSRPHDLLQRQPYGPEHIRIRRHTSRVPIIHNEYEILRSFDERSVVLLTCLQLPFHPMLVEGQLNGGAQPNLIKGLNNVAIM
jgi:hypothetical protein